MITTDTIITTSSGLVENLELLFAAVSSLSTIIAAAVACVALNNWKKIEKFKYTNALEDSFLELFNSYQKYLHLVHQASLLKLSIADMIHQHEEYKLKISIAELNKDVAYRNYVQCYDRVARLKADLADELSPQSIHNQFMSLTTNIEIAIKTNKLETYPSEEISNIWDKTRSLLCELR